MNRRSCILLLSALCSSAPLLSGQEINSTVEVQRDFESRLMNDIVKTPMKTSFSDTLRRFGLNFDYSVFDKPYNDLYEFTPRAAANINQNGEPVYPWLYFRGGISYPWTPDLDLFIQPRLGKNAFLTLFGTHRSFFGPLPEGENKNRYDTEAGAEFKYVWKKVEAKAGVDFTDLYYNFNSQSVRRSDILSAYAGVRSVNLDPTAFYYDVNMRYDGMLADATENDFGIDATLGATIKRIHRVALRTNVQVVTGAYLVELTPYYRFTRDRWNLDAGIAFSLTNLSTSFVMPDVKVSFEAVRKQLWISAALEGKNHLNSLVSMRRYNPISLADNPLSNSFEPFGASLGVNGAVRDRFTYSVKGFWSVVNNLLSFDAAQRSSLSYQQLYGAEVALGLQMSFVTGKVNFTYCGYSNYENAYMCPKVSGDASFTFNIRHRWFITLGCRGRGQVHYGTAGETVDVPGYADLNFNVTYRINHRISVYLRGDNLLNNKIYLMANYLEPGISAGGGVSFKF